MFVKIKNTNKSAFTLLELLVVISIIGLLSTLAVVALSSSRTKARDAKRVTEVNQMVKAIELYYDKKGYYPEYTTSLRCNSSTSLTGLVAENIMAFIPVDPKNTSTAPRYCYEYLGMGTSDTIFESAWYCSGRRRTDYQWSLQFSTESVSFNFPRLTNSSGVPNNEYIYCVHGPLR